MPKNPGCKIACKRFVKEARALYYMRFGFCIPSQMYKFVNQLAHFISRCKCTLINKYSAARGVGSVDKRKTELSNKLFNLQQKYGSKIIRTGIELEAEKRISPKNIKGLSTNYEYSDFLFRSDTRFYKTYAYPGII